MEVMAVSPPNHKHGYFDSFVAVSSAEMQAAARISHASEADTVKDMRKGSGERLSVKGTYD